MATYTYAVQVMGTAFALTAFVIVRQAKRKIELIKRMRGELCKQFTRIYLA